jgi:tellurite resistance protein TerC
MHSTLVWTLFAVMVVGALALDLGVFRRDARPVSMKEAGIWTAVWVSLALSFNGFIVYQSGTERGMQFLQGYLLELALSVDNVFVFLVVFRYFRVSQADQHRVLFWGIVGAVIARGVFIALGAALIERFHWVMYILGAFLIYTSIKLLLQRDEEFDPTENGALKLFQRFIPTTMEYHGARFLIRKDGRLFATPLLAVLVVVETADVMFAVDSIPAVFGVTRDVFIVYTSNIFAILGLRSLFFLIAGLVERLRYLKVGVVIILAFIGVKILIEPIFHIPVVASLAVLASVLTIAAVASLLIPVKDEASKGAAAEGGAPSREP